MRSASVRFVLLLLLPCVLSQQWTVSTHALRRLFNPGLPAKDAWNYSGYGTVERPALWQDFVLTTFTDVHLESDFLSALCADRTCGEGTMQWDMGVAGYLRGRFGAGSPVVYPSRNAETVQVYYLAGNPAQLMSFSFSNGQFGGLPQWWWQLPSEVTDPLPPAAGPNNTVFISAVCGNYTKLYVVQGDPVSSTATQTWELRNKGKHISAPVLYNSEILIVAVDVDSVAELHAYNLEDPSNLTRRWSLGPIGSPELARGISRPQILGDLVVLTTRTVHPENPKTGEVRLVAANITSGERALQDVVIAGDAEVASEPIWGEGRGKGSRLFLTLNATDESGPYAAVFAVGMATGDVVWSQEIRGDGGPISCASPVFVTVPTDTVVVVCATISDQFMLLYEPARGGPLGGVNLTSEGCTSPSGGACVGCLDSDLRWNCPPSSPVVDDNTGTVFVPGTADYLFAVTLTTHAPTISPTKSPTGSPSTIPPSLSPTSDQSISPLPKFLAIGAVGLLILVIFLAFVMPRMSQAASFSSRTPTVWKGSDQGVERYHIMRKLGTGAFGTVVLVKQRQTGEEFAMKVIPCQTSEDRESAIHEWQTLSSLPQNPNMIRVVEVFLNWNPMGAASGTDSPRYVEQIQTKAGEDTPQSTETGFDMDTAFCSVCIVMPYFPEGDLRHFVKLHDRPIPERVILSFAAQIASALNVLHSRKPPIIHRDLKPENILLDAGGTRVVVTDFGLARDCDTAYCRTHAGTVAYVAPEMWERRYSVEVDLWGLGCVLYAVVSRRVDASNCRVLWREASNTNFQNGIAEEIMREGYSLRLAHLVSQLLSPAPAMRPTASAIVNVLSTDLAGVGTTPITVAQQRDPTGGPLSISPTGGSPEPWQRESVATNAGTVPQGNTPPAVLGRPRKPSVSEFMS
eukprot:Hpha_TRINITY_DN15532_c3_g9::TRINITY_DN15532_c3_g9_i1::g.109078::m.109078